MKKILYILSVLVLVGTTHKAYAAIPVGFNATSTDKGFVQPNMVNGNNPLLNIPATGTSTFAGSISVTGGISAGYITAPIFSTGACSGTAFTIDSPTFSVDCTNHRVGITMNLLGNMAYPLQVESSISGANSTLLYVHNYGGGVNSVSSIGFGIFGANNNTENGRLGVIRTNRAVTGDSDMLFSTYSNGSLGERMRILDNGNVGIGTTTPSTSLDVKSAANAIAAIVQGSGAGAVGIGSNGVPFIQGYTNDSMNASANLTLQTNSGSNVGVGTSSPYAKLSVQSALSTGDAFVVATSSTAAVFGIDNDGHTFTSGPAPFISSCGTGTGTVVGDDQSGTITTATAATACTATFAKAYRNTPVCVVSDDSTVGFADISTISTTAVTFGISSALTGGHLYYDCKYHK